MALIPSFFSGGRRSNIFDPFSIDVWDPFDGFPIGGAVANVPSSAAKDASALANVRIDWRETPDAHIIKADLPGLDKREVKVEIEDGRILQISGESRREQEEKDDKWHRVERIVGRFVRRFRLPENARVDQVKATMENGVLSVVIPKEQEKRPESRPIQISGGGAEGGGVSGGATGGATGGGGVFDRGATGGAGGGGVFERDRPAGGEATGGGF
ncbi:17.4 kDa class I heat shock protein-like [Rhododendron vialii]|uniref:17.4 kDa class I heat shock protein-like n=1 Tax=Rhododendron vialii TaxID=182163 RepID=UPI0026600E2C|nr:17.4 kDa class I heat shock protein-like [Rhododendron vialii]